MTSTVDRTNDIARTVTESVRTLDHLYSGILSRPVVDTATALAATLPKTLEKVLLLSTGAESNEAALKLAKLYAGPAVADPAVRRACGPGSTSSVTSAAAA